METPTQPPNPLVNAVKNKVVRSSNFLGEPEEYDPTKDVAVVKALSAERYLQMVELRLKGLRFDYDKRVWVRFRDPIMNETGIGNFLATLQAIADDVYFSNFDEKEISRLAYYYFQENWPDIKIYAKDFGLEPRDFNVIKSILFFFPLSALKNAKNAGHRNVVRGTLSEQVYMKAFDQQQQQLQQKKSGSGFALFRNPFRRNQ